MSKSAPCNSPIDITYESEEDDNAMHEHPAALNGLNNAHQQPEPDAKLCVEYVLTNNAINTVDHYLTILQDTVRHTRPNALYNEALPMLEGIHALLMKIQEANDNCEEM